MEAYELNELQALMQPGTYSHPRPLTQWPDRDGCFATSTTIYHRERPAYAGSWPQGTLSLYGLTVRKVG